MEHDAANPNPTHTAHTRARTAVVVSRYNASITDKLLEAALDAFAQRCPDAPAPAVIDAAGAFELPAVCSAAAATGNYDGILAIGCIIKGETSHDAHIASAVARGLVQITLQTGVPVSFGVLTVDNPDQARARAGGDRGNKGRDSMLALLDTVATIDALRSGATSVAVKSDMPDKAEQTDERYTVRGID